MKKYILIIILGGLIFFAYYFIKAPSIQRIEETAELTFPTGAKLKDWTRLSENPESDILYEVTFEKEDGLSFCNINKIPLGKPEKGTRFGESQTMPLVVESKLKNDYKNIVCYALVSKPKDTMFLAVESRRVLIYFHEQ